MDCEVSGSQVKDGEDLVLDFSSNHCLIITVVSIIGESGINRVPLCIRKELTVDGSGEFLRGHMVVVCGVLHQWGNVQAE